MSMNPFAHTDTLHSKPKTPCMYVWVCMSMYMYVCSSMCGCEQCKDKKPFLPFPYLFKVRKTFKFPAFTKSLRVSIIRLCVPSPSPSPWAEQFLPTLRPFLLLLRLDRQDSSFARWWWRISSLMLASSELVPSTRYSFSLFLSLSPSLPMLSLSSHSAFVLGLHTKWYSCGDASINRLVANNWEGAASFTYSNLHSPNTHRFKTGLSENLPE